MRICIIGAYASVHTRRWASHFAERGHDVHVVSTGDVPLERPAGMTLHRLPLVRTGSRVANALAAVAGAPVAALRLRRLLRRIRPDVVHVHYINDAAVLARLAGARPLVLTAWGSDVLVSLDRSPLRRRAVSATLRAADLVTCDADHMARRLVELGAPKERVEVVFFGTDVRRYAPGRRDEALRARLAPAGGLIVVSIRSLEPIYDIPTLVRAAPLVLAQRPDATFVVGGRGSLEGELRALAASLGVAERVRFTGALTQDELPAHLASADVYVSTALSDGGLAASTAEAMAAGTPVVVTDVGDNRQWVEDGKTGRVVPPGSPEALASAILALLRDPDAARGIGVAGREVIVARNNLDVEMGRMESLYRRLAETR